MAKFAFEFDQHQVQLLMVVAPVMQAVYAALGNNIQEQLRKGPMPDQPPVLQPRGNGEANFRHATTPPTDDKGPAPNG